MTQVIDFIGGEYRNRTGVHGFAIRCITTLPTRRQGSVRGISSIDLRLQGLLCSICIKLTLPRLIRCGTSGLK